MFGGNTTLIEIPQYDTSSWEDISYMLDDCYVISNIPMFDFSSVLIAEKTFSRCKKLTNLNLNMPNVKNVYGLCANCESLVTFGGLDMKNVNYSPTNMFYGCSKLTNLTLKNIKVDLTIGEGKSWGHLLTLDSLINTIKELVDTGSSKTLTMGSANLNKIANVYVRLTGEAEEVEGLTKVPCEVCESTDEGAMLITAYANSKNWTLA
jgi:hypothetical protein